MPIPMQDRNRVEIRHPIGRNLGIVIIGAITAVPGTPDKTSVIDTTNLTGGDDEHNGKQIMIYDATGSIVDGEIRRVTDYTGSTTSDLTTSAFSANTTVLDKYELWDTPWLISDIHDAIDQAFMAVTKNCLNDKKTENTWTVEDTYEYDWLSGFVGLHTVDYVSSVGIEVVIDRCDTAWTAGTSVTATADTTWKKQGTASAKLVVAAGAATGGTLGYGTISSTDLSECDAVEIWIRSSIALTAGQLDLVLSSSAALAATTESLDIPATAANTPIRHVIDLANPLSDTAIISVGIVNTTDVGAFTLYIDNIVGIKKTSRVYKELNPQYWQIVRNSTNYLKFTSAGKSVVGDNTLIRLTGYQIPALLTDDTTDSTVDPDYIIAQATGMLAIGHAKSARLQIKDRATFAKYWLGRAESLKSGIRSTIHSDSSFF